MQTFARVGADIAMPLALVSDPQTVAAIQINDVLLLGLGEYFADQSQGTPWIQKILGQKNPSITAIATLLRNRILTVDNVARVIDVSVTFDPGARKFAYNWAAVLTDGTVATGSGTS